MNPPAFPVITDYLSKGMTLRDYFAAKAMQALLQHSGPRSEQTWFTAVSEGSYRVADAMLKERDK